MNKYYEFLKNCANNNRGTVSLYKNKSEIVIKSIKYLLEKTNFLDIYYNNPSINKRNVKLTYSVRISYLLSNMKDIKRCEMCGSPVIKEEIKACDDINLLKNMRFCSSSCAANNDIVQNQKEETCLKNNGVRHPSQNSSILEQMQKTCLKIYGVKNPSQNNEVKDKKVKTLITNYGCKSYFESDEFKRINRERWGVDFISQSDCVKLSVIETKRKNKSFNKSKIEDIIYKMFCQKFGIENVLRQYSNDNRYPFSCDFYISNMDLFIEYNGHWTHGKHPFDKNNKSDKNILNSWQKKSEGSIFYKNAINVWTKRDVNKRYIAKVNNLKYIELWTLNDVFLFLEGVNN